MIGEKSIRMIERKELPCGMILVRSVSRLQCPNSQSFTEKRIKYRTSPENSICISITHVICEDREIFKCRCTYLLSTIIIGVITAYEYLR